MRRRSGFSLVEVVLSTAILGMVMMLVFNLLPTSMLALNAAESREQAEALASSWLEKERALPISALASQTLPASGPYQPTLSVTEVTPSLLYRLTVSVRWSDAGGNHQVTLSGYVSWLSH